MSKKALLFRKAPVTLSSFVGHVPANFNMMPWSNGAQATDFSQTYLLTNASITGGVVSPSGATNAQKLVENSAAGNHRVYSFNNALCTTSSQCIFRVAVIAKAAERTRIVVFSETYLHETAISASVGFDLAGGNVGYDTAVGSQTTLVDYAMTSLSFGWWLCTFDYQYTGSYLGGSCVMQPKIYLDNGSGTAARSISYTGNGSSGADLWWLSLMPIGAWKTWTNVFFDDFTSTNTIDLGNTLAPGFNWYINNIAPNSINPAWWADPPLYPSLAANFVISSPSVLKLFDASGSSRQWQTMMYSVAFPNAGGYIGNAWQGSVVFDGYFSWDSSVLKSPAFWGHAVEAMAGTIASNAHWLEWDWIDQGTTTSSVNDEYVSGGTPYVINRSTNWGGGGYMAAGVWNRLSGMRLTMADNNNSYGTFMSFFNGQMVNYTDVAYNGSENQPPLVNANQVLLSSFEPLHTPIMLDETNGTVGGGGPMYIDWVRVYT